MPRFVWALILILLTAAAGYGTYVGTGEPMACGMITVAMIIISLSIFSSLPRKRTRVVMNLDESLDGALISQRHKQALENEYPDASDVEMRAWRFMRDHWPFAFPDPVKDEVAEQLAREFEEVCFRKAEDLIRLCAHESDTWRQLIRVYEERDNQVMVGYCRGGMETSHLIMEKIRNGWTAPGEEE